MEQSHSPLALILSPKKVVIKFPLYNNFLGDRMSAGGECEAACDCQNKMCAG